MIMVVIVALVLAPFSWSSPGLIVVELILIVASPFLLDLLEGGQDRLSPLKVKAKRLPRRLRTFTWMPPPHKSETPEL
jgi:hypothetical protein